MLAQIRPAVVLLLMLTVLTGVVYPLSITGIAQLIWPQSAHGSLSGARDGSWARC